jgi:catechol 2,3-dioxygenase-like lactoylglutathione lyase family enzyme
MAKKAIRAAVVLLLGFTQAIAQPRTGQQQGPQSATASTSIEVKGKQTMSFQSLTPNLIVGDMDRSVAFYRNVLGFEQAKTVPEKPPYVFVSMEQGGVVIFLNAAQPLKSGTPVPLAGQPAAGTNSMYIKLRGIDELAARVEKHGIKPVIAMHKEFYGMREFAVLDPDGYLIIFAEPTE